MHPRVRQAGPGNCPIRGMALEPETAVLAGKSDPELIDMTGRFWVSTILATLLLKVMGEHFIPWIHETLNGDAGRWLQLAFATPVVMSCG